MEPFQRKSGAVAAAIGAVWVLSTETLPAPLPAGAPHRALEDPLCHLIQCYGASTLVLWSSGRVCSPLYRLSHIGFPLTLATIALCCLQHTHTF